MNNSSSYVQCRWLNVWSVLFPAGMGGVQNRSGNSGGVGVGVVFLVVKKWKFRGGGGLGEIPSMVGV